ncbi:ribonuclease HI [bacterium]|nr:ribonuclease HI [bacterium]
MNFIRCLVRSVLSPIHIYTDGSLKAGKGAWAFVIVRGDRVILESFGVGRNTTSNRMEFHAAIEAVKRVSAFRRIHLFTDSRVLLEAVEKLDEWRSLGWVKKNSAPIPSVDQMKELDRLIRGRSIQWSWVRAHSGNPYNERCDQLCIKARD